MENVIVKVTDEDLGLPKNKLLNPTTRYGARGIIFDENGNIAIFNKTKKNEFKLPGGGIKDGETPIEAFKREIMEETGCYITRITELGLSVEEKSKTNFCQISYVFQAFVKENTHQLHLTDKEHDEGAQLLWLPLEEAFNMILKCLDTVTGSDYDDRYRTLFMIKRDALILKYYIEKYQLDKKKAKK